MTRLKTAAGLLVLGMVTPAAVAGAQQPQAPANQPSTPAPPQTATEAQRAALLRQIEDLRRQAEELERSGQVMSSQVATKPLAVIEAEGNQAAEALKSAKLAMETARWNEAETQLKRAIGLVEGLFGQNEVWATALNNLALTYHHQGRLAEAEPAYVKVLHWRDSVPDRDHSDMSATVHNLGMIYYDQGRYEEAQLLITRAYEERLRRVGPEHQNTLVSQVALGALHMAQQRYDEAERILTDAARTSERALGAEHEWTLGTLSNLGVLYRRMRRFAEAEQLLQRVLSKRLAAQRADHPDTLYSLDVLGLLYKEQGRFADAERMLTRSVAGRQRVLGPDHPLTLSSAADLATVRLAQAKPGEALEAARAAVAGARTRRGGAAADRYAEAQRAREEVGERRAYGLLANAAWGAAAPGQRGTLEGEAFTALQDALGGGEANRAIAQMAVRRLAADRGAAVETLLRERAELNERWLGNMQRYAQAEGMAGEGATGAREQLRTDRIAITERLAQVDQRLQADFPDYFSLIKPQALDVAAAQRLLSPDEAILLTVPTEFGTHVMAVTRTELRWARSDWTAERVQAAAERLRWDASGIAQGDADRVRAWQEMQRPNAPASFDRGTAYQLYQELVAPVEAALAGKKQLYVAAGGPLAALPFSLLVTQAPQGGDNDPRALRATGWLADRYALVHIPSVQSLELLRRASGGAKGDSGDFVGFGDPELSGAPAARRGGVPLPGAQAVIESARAPWGGAMASVSALRRMPQLPGTARELASMRQMFGESRGQVFTRAAATEGAVRSADLSKARVIAFATHGLTPGEMVAGAEGTRTASELFELVEPGLVLTPPDQASEQDDGYLAASEVTALRLDADWVILSACNSATPDNAAEPGLSSLARAFFYAGARNLLASHWPVDDDVGARITVRTIELERSGRPRAEAFQQAMREIREDASRDSAEGSWAHPFYWAPFVLIGDGGARR
jgi:CHAT domain-containing protein